MSWIMVKACKCDEEGCGHIWIPDTSNPDRCPSRKCRSRNWNQKSKQDSKAAKVKAVPKSAATPEAPAVEKPTPLLSTLVPEAQPPKPKPIVIDRGHNKSTCRIYGCLLCGSKES